MFACRKFTGGAIPLTSERRKVRETEKLNHIGSSGAGLPYKVILNQDKEPVQIPNQSVAPSFGEEL